jgi:hypothetical protein
MSAAIMAWYFSFILRTLFTKLKNLTMRKTIGLLLGAAAAYGIYKYSKLSPSEKNELRSRGKDFLDKQLGGVNNLFGKKQNGVHS